MVWLINTMNVVTLTFDTVYFLRYAPFELSSKKEKIKMKILLQLQAQGVTEES